ncbi:hypothetical protein AQUCO_07300025v1 [Aquilegia coerulea]|uniref:gibberellin 2beta-dioxygenase n=1 Tax=Aquilegia coerulea TaxID=218851 RepID=A0A2G5C9W3_AQUCA|nr:hypothetical protein AQUCO_07300025v1 [Aquilegia coerulea]
MVVSFHDVPIIDLSCNKSLVAELVVKASEEYGFFMVMNHGVCKDVIDRMEKEGLNFFGKPASEKRLAGPPNPFGYGTKYIGSNGDTGEVEYLLLNNNPQSISQTSKSISNNPKEFNCVVNDYMEAVRNLACEILELMTEGLHVDDNKSVLSNYIRDVDCDSLIRLNHYPPYKGDTSSAPSSHSDLDGDDQGCDQDQLRIVGFGEHSDPQILTLLRSNDVGGLQILLEDEMWVPVPPDPMAFCVNVGDTLQALTNGRFKSVIHRALVNSSESRMSVIYFAAAPLHAWISPIPNLVTPQKPSLYRPFTWSEYKKTTYSLRLGDSRLDLFKVQQHEEQQLPEFMRSTST